MSQRVERAFPAGVSPRAPMRGDLRQLVRFGVVGASGYVVNLVVFTGILDVAHCVVAFAATAAFVVSVINNFALNRRWTFAAVDGAVTSQLPRFFAVSTVSLGVGLVALSLLRDVGLAPLVAQATSILAVTPINFGLSKRWSFAC